MSANGGDESTLSLADISVDDDELREAFAVLAGSDPEKCSYPEGYMKRQAVFACNTCTSGDMEPAGVCLACANHCHDGHDIFELYTKRNFRCDCGNGKFGSFECKLNPGKDRQNIKNQYNHNFFGRYCACDRPYPDDDDQVNDEMIQCVVCEDWYHSKHLGCLVVDSEELLEMVCESCMNKAPFLWTYASHYAVPPLTKLSPCKEDSEVNVEEEEEASGGDKKESPCASGREWASTSCSTQNGTKLVTNGTAGVKRTHQEMENCPMKCQSKSVHCVLRELKAKELTRVPEGAVFWPYFWRAKLCTCTDCKRAYVKAGVEFLLDETDTLLAYENKGKSQTWTGEELLMSCLSSLDRVQQLEIIYQFNDLKTELTEFLQQFADEGKVVTPEAIRTFFEDLQNRKRRRTNVGQYYCS
ncbi:putative E3 ubiquitin-protein ligase UBR7 [Chanos chanos]|uniref:Putative E3 ubiquitin-protein ligase UBR7 n=1 Tax=Chanos chanos TaxID=29144 RepID=A0A6J2VZC3_CHACN|nr:putative E3 ubiquitin-protein ligase UBR7 [Chanos chanos]